MPPSRFDSPKRPSTTLGRLPVVTVPVNSRMYSRLGVDKLPAENNAARLTSAAPQPPPRDSGNRSAGLLDPANWKVAAGTAVPV